MLAIFICIMLAFVAGVAVGYGWGWRDGEEREREEVKSIARVLLAEDDERQEAIYEAHNDSELVRWNAGGHA